MPEKFEPKQRVAKNGRVRHGILAPQLTLPAAAGVTDLAASACEAAVAGRPRRAAAASDGGGSSAVEVWVVTPAMDSREFSGGVISWRFGTGFLPFR